jgi:S-adenosylmethionine:tRNA ribosyltransferase-isomerase
MVDPLHIRSEDFTYDLPEERIARFPLSDRDGSRLLIYRSGQIRHDVFRNLPDLLPENAHLVFNNTRVIKARLPFRKSSGARIEIFCLEPAYPASIEESLGERKATIWKCMIGNQKKWKSGALSAIISAESKIVELQADYHDRAQNLVQFTWNDPQVSFAEILQNHGKVPIPPYLNRDSQPVDQEAYQTVYAAMQGSVAAPTAGLHFSSTTLEKLHQRPFETTELTLHVSAGTFKPVQATQIGAHEMHAEFFTVGKEALLELASSHRPIMAIGTTALRTLESLFWLAQKIRKYGPQDALRVEQWEAYSAEPHLTRQESFQVLYQYLTEMGLDRLEGITSLMVVPGYPFQVADALLTNYHLPKSTLLMLVAAFIGPDWKRVYRYALDHGFRFLSYGDSSLLFRNISARSLA